MGDRANARKLHQIHIHLIHIHGQCIHRPSKYRLPAFHVEASQMLSRCIIYIYLGYIALCAIQILYVSVPSNPRVCSLSSSCSSHAAMTLCGSLPVRKAMVSCPLLSMSKNFSTTITLMFRRTARHHSNIEACPCEGANGPREIRKRYPCAPLE